LSCIVCGHTRRWHGDFPTYESSLAGDKCLGLRGKGGCNCAGFAAPFGKPRKHKVSEEAYLGCVGWAWSPSLAMCAPATIEYWQDPVVFAAVMAEIRSFHADTNVDFGGQNQPFD